MGDVDEHREASMRRIAAVYHAAHSATWRTPPRKQLLYHARFQASAAVQLRSSPFWVVYVGYIGVL